VPLEARDGEVSKREDGEAGRELEWELGLESERNGDGSKGFGVPP